MPAGLEHGAAAIPRGQDGVERSETHIRKLTGFRCAQPILRARNDDLRDFPIQLVKQPFGSSAKSGRFSIADTVVLTRDVSGILDAHIGGQDSGGYDAAFPRRDHARGLRDITRLERRGRRECRVLCCTRSLAWDGRNHTSVVTTGEAATNDTPCAMVLTLMFALSPVSMTF